MSHLEVASPKGSKPYLPSMAAHTNPNIVSPYSEVAIAALEKAKIELDEARLKFQRLPFRVIDMFGNEYQEARTRLQASKLAHDKLVVKHKEEGILVAGKAVSKATQHQQEIESEYQRQKAATIEARRPLASLQAKRRRGPLSTNCRSPEFQVALAAANAQYQPLSASTSKYRKELLVPAQKALDEALQYQVGVLKLVKNGLPPSGASRRA